MLKSFQKIIAVTVAFMTVMAYGVPTQAALMTNASVRLTNAAAGQGSDYIFSARTTTGGEIKGIRMLFRAHASDGAATADQNLTGTSLASTDRTGISADNWTINTSAAGTGVISIVNAGGVSINANTIIGWRINGIINPSIGGGGCNANQNNSSGTCFIRIQTHSTAVVGEMLDGTVIDEVTVAFAVNAAVVVTAKVDPSLTFTVNGVAQGQVANGVITSASSQFNTLPFGFLQTNSPKYLAHDLTVRTNANNGYTVTVRMASQMTGTYAVNNVDPFAAPGSTWGTPTSWVSPTGNIANVDTGWVGAHTNNTGLSGFSSGTWGPVGVTANQVMSSSTPDLGNVATRVTFAIEVNVFQPSDNYTGTLVYNCTPTY